MFRHKTDAHRGNIKTALPLNFLPIKDNPTFFGRCQSQNRFKRRCFTGPIASQQNRNAALWHTHRYPFQNMKLTNKCMNLLNFE